MSPTDLPIRRMPILALEGKLALEDEPVRGAAAVPALPLPVSARRSIAPDAAFDRDVQVALGRQRRERDSDADEVLSGHRGPITAGED